MGPDTTTQGFEQLFVNTLLHAGLALPIYGLWLGNEPGRQGETTDV